MQNTNTGKNTPAIPHPHYLTRGAPRAHRRWAALGIALLTAMGLVAVSAPASAHRPQAPGEILVRASAGGLSLSRNVIHAGEVTITVEAPKADVGTAFMFKLVAPATLKTLRADVKDMLSDAPKTAARGARNMTRHARFYGVLEAPAGQRGSLRQTLSAGTYYLTDDIRLINGSPHLVPLRVHGSLGHTARKPEHNPRIFMTTGNRFDLPRSLPAKATISVRNASGSVHMMKMWRVVKGTTDKKVQAWLDGSGQDPSVEKPSMDLNMLSPWRKVDLTYDLPAGSYLFFCSLKDAKTGVPHVLTGMYKVVTLK